MARAWLLDVPCRQRRDGCVWPTLGLDIEPQLHRPARTTGPYPPGEPGKRCGGRDRGCHHRCANHGALSMPKPFNKLTAVAAPIMRSNIDTDVSLLNGFGMLSRSEEHTS